MNYQQQQQQEQQQIQQQIQEQDNRTTTRGQLGPRNYEASIYSHLGENMNNIIIEWTRENYIVLLDMLHAINQDEFETTLYLSELLSTGLYQAGFYKPDASLHTHLKNSNIVRDYIEHVQMYICNCAGIAELEEINVDINNEDQVLEAFIFYYLLQRHVMVNEFVEIRDSPILK